MQVPGGGMLRIGHPARSGTATARLAALLAAAACGLGLFPAPALALDIDEYLTYSYSLELSKATVRSGEAFSATVTGTAVCRKDLPLTPSKARATSHIVARHATSGATVVLHESYTLALASVPARRGESVEKAVTLLLAFPEGTPAGTYAVVAELVEASIHVVVWLEVTQLLPRSEVLGTITCEAPPVETTPLEPPTHSDDTESPASPEETGPDAANTEMEQVTAPANAEVADDWLPVAPVISTTEQHVEQDSGGADRLIETEDNKPAAAPSLRATSLVVSPARTAPGQPVAVSATVVNGGEAEASSTISLLLDGRAEKAVEVRLSGGEARELEFTVAANVIGPHEIAVAGLTGTFTVVERDTADVAGRLPTSTGKAALWVVAAVLGVGDVFAGLLVVRREYRAVDRTR